MRIWKREGKNWRLHVNCTSSGALVNSIPGTCWSAIHMTVPCYLISSLQKKIDHLKWRMKLEKYKFDMKF